MRRWLGGVAGTGTVVPRRGMPIALGVACRLLRGRAAAGVTRPVTPPLGSPAAGPAAVAAPGIAAGAAHADGHAPEHDGFGPFARWGLEAGHRLAGDAALDETFDIGEEDFLVQAHQRDRLAAGPRPPGAADAVHIILGHVGQLEVDDVGQLVDVDAAGRDVGGHQHLERAGLELGQRLGARPLALVAVDRHRGDPLIVQVLGQPVRAVLHAREDEHLVPIAVANELGKQILLLLAADRVNLLRDGVCRGVAASHLDQRRLVQQSIGQGLDLVAEGGAEQQALLPGRQQRQHLADVVDEAHVQHAVGLVEHEDLHLAQVQRALLVVVEEASRRGHQDVDALAEPVDLGLHADATEHDHAGQRQVLAVGAHALFDLRGEFAGGRQNQRANGDAALGVAHRAGSGQPVQHRQREAGGLARAGLGSGHEVTPLQDGRNRLGLDRGRVLVALLAHGAQDRLGEAEIAEVHGDGSPATADYGSACCCPGEQAPVVKADGEKGSRRRPRRRDWSGSSQPRILARTALRPGVAGTQAARAPRHHSSPHAASANGAADQGRREAPSGPIARPPTTAPSAVPA